jgi:hypothetical protein
VNDRDYKSNRGRGASASDYGYAAPWFDVSSRKSLRGGDKVIAARPLRNDGTYPHEDVGAILVRRGDLGYVVEIVNSGGDEYYTVEFVARAVVCETRRKDITPIRDN